MVGFPAQADRAPRVRLERLTPRAEPPPPAADELAALAQRFRSFAEHCRRDGAPLYARICDAAADDEDLMAVVAGAAPAQRRPNILLAAVHFLLLCGVEHPLERHYPTVAAWRGVGVPGPGPSDPAEDFADFCRIERDALAHLIATRATQTNEVGRCAFLLPALGAIAARNGGPLALVDLGTSAGLNLSFDRYRYDYGAAGRHGVAGSPVVVRCEIRGTRVPALDTPAVAARIGVDRAPVDPCDSDGGRWLLACQWPDHPERFSTLWAAIRLTCGSAQRPEVIDADMVEGLAGAVAAMPGAAHLCVLHTWAAAYLSEARQRQLVAAVAEVSGRRPVSWLFAEYPPEVPGLPVPGRPPGEDRISGATALVLIDAGPGRPTQAWRLADVHPHGRWLRWYGARHAPLEL